MAGAQAEKEASGMIGRQKVRQGPAHTGPCRPRELAGPGKVCISYTQRQYSSVFNSTLSTRLHRFKF